jgi:tetratricopeptide (TPR) repeat protein
MARLSLCLIARNEEEMLPGCLASVRGVADEIVLVDTGSTDRTVEVAREAGARVLERPWDDDFAAPRNLAARHARGSWLLVLDADERLAPGAAGPLRDAMNLRTFDVGMVRLHNARRADAPAHAILSGAERHGRPVLLPRLVRNEGQPTWRGAIHESVGEWLVARDGRRRDLDVDVLHLGYVPAMLVSRGKRERNIGLLRRRCAAEPDDVTPRGYLALELLEAGDFQSARAVADEAWAMLPRQPAHRDLSRIAVARGLLALRRPDPAEALDAAGQGEARNGPHPDYDYLRGFAQEILAVRAAPRSPERAAALAAAEASYRACLARLAAGGAWDFLGAVNEARAGMHLGVVLLLAGRAREALAAFADVLRAEPANGAARVGAAEALLDVGEPAQALRTVEGALGSQPDGWLVAASAAHALGSGGDARLFLDEARRRVAVGYECLHRWARQEALERAVGG